MGKGHRVQHDRIRDSLIRTDPVDVLFYFNVENMLNVMHVQCQIYPQCRKHVGAECPILLQCRKHDIHEYWR